MTLTLRFAADAKLLRCRVVYDGRARMLLGNSSRWCSAFARWFAGSGLPRERAARRGLCRLLASAPCCKDTANRVANCGILSSAT